MPTLCVQRETPSLVPTLQYLSVYQARSKRYCQVFVHGSGFLSPAIGTTVVQFGSYGTLPTTYYHAHMLSFLVPLDVAPGTYPVSVLNLNDNLLARNSRFAEPPQYLASWSELPFDVLP